MRGNFSPTLEAARRAGTRLAPAKASTATTPPMGERWCEWPRRLVAAAPRGSIWRALQEIQTRHA